MKTLSFSILLSLTLSITSCNDGGSSDGGSSGGGDTVDYTPIPTKYLGTWIRDDLNGPSTDDKCDESYDVDGGGTSATESQTAQLIVSSNDDANGLQYEWYMFMTAAGSSDCSFSSAFFTDGIIMGDIEIVSDSGSVLILKTKVSINSRNLNGFADIRTAMNGYNTSLGACGNTDWNIHSTNAAEFQADCGVVDGDIGMDDYKMSGASFAVGQTLYWKLTNVDSTHMTFAASTDGGTTYSSASSLFLKTP